MFEIHIDKQFSAAHALRLPDGTLEPKHGHDWRLRVGVGGDGLDAMDTVMDFHELERIVESVIGPWRNQDLNRVSPFGSAEDEGLRINPSAERVAEVVAGRVSESLSGGVRLLAVTVGEAPGCTAVYRPAD